LHFTITTLFKKIRDFSVDSIENGCSTIERIESSYSSFEEFIIQFN